MMEKIVANKEAEILKILSTMADNAKEQAVLMKTLKHELDAANLKIDLQGDRIDALESQANAGPFTWPGLGH